MNQTETGPVTPGWQRIEALFPDLLELPADQRAAFLDRHCAGDPALRAELESLLAASEGHGVLDDIPQLSGGDAPEPASEVAAGTRIGPWQVERLLGRGGMGEVYFATRVEGGFVQDAAVKLVRADAAQHLARFDAERSILAQLDHPNIARLLDGGVTASGRPYMAMEFVQGHTLREWMRRERPDLPARLALFGQLCRAVAYAHSHLVIHRDLKPGNVLVTGDGQAKLLDFGIATLLDGSAADATLAPLTPNHAAPEQLQGLPASTAMDVYGLGLLLYELLSGAPPWKFEHRPLSAAVETLLSQEPAPPSRSARAQADPPVPPKLIDGDLDAIVGKCLRTRPQDRYATVEALLDDLQRHRERRPVLARGNVFGYIARRWLRRHRGGVAAAGLVLLALLGGLGLTLWQAGVAREQTRVALAEKQRAEAQTALARSSAERARQVKEFLISVFAQEDPLKRDARGALTLADAYADARKRAAAEGMDPALQADLLDDFGEIEAGRGHLDEARSLFEQAHALAVQAHGEGHPATAESLINLGVVQAWRGSPLEGRASLEQAVAILDRHADIEPGMLANALSGLANVYHNQARYDEAIPLLERALQLRRQIDPQDYGLHSAMNNLAVMLHDRGRNADAEPLLREAVAIVERHQGPQGAALVPLLATRGSVLSALNRPDEARALHERRLAIARATYPGDHLWVAAALADSAADLADGGRVDAGLARMGEAVAMLERLDSARLGRTLASQSRLLRRYGDAAEADAVLERALHACTAKRQDSTPACQLARADLGLRLAGQGRAAEALAIADDAADRIAGSVGENTRSHASAQLARARVLAALGRADEAAQARRRAVEILETLLGPDHPETREAGAGD